MKQLLLNLVLSTLLIFSPVKATLFAVIALSLIDLLSGLLVAKKRGDPITSSGLKRTIVKLLVYEMVVLLGFITQQYLTGDLIPLVKILAGLIGITELKSVLENIEELTGLSLIKLLIDKLSQQQ
jgi:phage-related holin